MKFASEIKMKTLNDEKGSQVLLREKTFNTHRQVKAIPAESFSSGSNIPYRVATSLFGSAMMG